MMLSQVIVDTSALVAVINKRDSYHDWVCRQLSQIAPPLLTCEAVLSETWFLLRRVRGGHDSLLLLLEKR